MIRIEFWNGQLSNKPKYYKYNGLVTTSHNPCLWSNKLDDKPWRGVYKKAIEYIDDWKLKNINDTQLLHCLRYVAYGYNDNGIDKRCFNDNEVVWPGNLTTKHKPKLVYKNDITNENFTLYFIYTNDTENEPTKEYWNVQIDYQTDFYWTI